MVVAEHNYGEGSAREHAAMQPRYLGCQIVLAKSFARIHETNLKKQGVLPLTFAQESDYELFTRDCVVETRGLVEMLEFGKDLSLVIKVGGQEKVLKVAHTMSKDQIDWFKAGGALNYIASSKI